MTSVENVSNQLISWLLIVIGWVIVHYLTHMRERQKEVREQKNRIVERILDIERRSIAFHQSSNYSQDTARELLSEIERVSSAISRQPLSLLSIQPSRVKKFRREITLKNFDSSRFQPQSATSRLLSDISMQAESLVDALEQGYARRYLVAWWQAFRI